MFSKIEVDNNSQSTQRKGSYPEDSQMSNLDVYVYMFANVCMHRWYWWFAYHWRQWHVSIVDVATLYPDLKVLVKVVNGWTEAAWRGWSFLFYFLFFVSILI